MHLASTEVLSDDQGNSEKDINYCKNREMESLIINFEEEIEMEAQKTEIEAQEIEIEAQQTDFPIENDQIT